MVEGKDSRPGLFAFAAGLHQDALSAVFTGRERELHALHEMLRESGGIPAFLVGPGGVGKTALARTYAARYASAYSASLLLSARNFGSPEALFGYLQSPESNGAFKRRREPALGNHSPEHRRLVVIDDLDIFGHAVLSYTLTILYSMATRFTTLCITRARLPFLESAEVPTMELRLGSLSSSELTELIRNYSRLAGIEESLPNRFLEEVRRQRLPFESLPISFILRLLDGFLRRRDFPGVLASATADHFVRASNIIVLEQAGRLTALPAVRDDLVDIVAPSNALLRAVPYVVVPHLGTIWAAQLEEFEEILRNPDSPEKRFQEFFERNPHFLQGVEYKRIVAQPVLAKEEGGRLIPDFMLQPVASPHADILDLKRPETKLLVGTENRRRFSQSVQEAIAQVREYRDFFEESGRRETVYRRYGLTAYRPNAVIVIGRQPKLPQVRLRPILEDVPSYVRVRTYDEVLERMRRLVEIRSGVGQIE